MRYFILSRTSYITATEVRCCIQSRTSCITATEVRYCIQSRTSYITATEVRYCIQSLTHYITATKVLYCIPSRTSYITATYYYSQQSRLARSVTVAGGAYSHGPLMHIIIHTFHAQCVNHTYPLFIQCIIRKYKLTVHNYANVLSITLSQRHCISFSDEFIFLQAKRSRVGEALSSLHSPPARGRSASGNGGQGRITALLCTVCLEREHKTGLTRPHSVAYCLRLIHANGQKCIIIYLFDCK